MKSSSSLVNATRQNNALTANGAITNSTSLSACLDLFFIAGATRTMLEEAIIDMFLKARAENRTIAYQILFWARDCRGGAGEKRFFRTIAKHLLTSATLAEEWEHVAMFAPFFGSWKDTFEIEKPDENVLNWLHHQLMESPTANLLAKWFPRKGPWFTAMHKYLAVTPKQLREWLVQKTTVVEHQICKKEFSVIEYSKVPSVAMNRYRKLFTKWDATRFAQFNEDVLAGKTKVNASVLFPYQLYQALCKGEDATAVEAQWNSLPDYMKDSTERIIPVCDVSGSMEGLPMDVSVSLGLYIAERNQGIFKNAFITFSAKPKMQYVQGTTLQDKLYSISQAGWGYNTNLQATFELILRSAVQASVPQSEMPTKVLIISDMEFDMACPGGSNLDAIKAQYQKAGYDMPEIIFWNVNARVGNVPASMDDARIGLVSGFSPAILTAVLQGEVLSPYQLMLAAVDCARYAPVKRALESM